MDISNNLIYIAGKLNGKTAIEYIQNVHTMVKYAEKVRKLGFSIMVPGNDVICGFICGTHEYDDYWKNNVTIMKRCDALAMVPNWRDSKGAVSERKIALEEGIIVLDTWKDVVDYGTTLSIIGE
jgi:hypothetical protein